MNGQKQMDEGETLEQISATGGATCQQAERNQSELVL